MAIIFKEDWKHYPNAIVDTKTKNKSFLRIAALYKKMNIDHYYFCLALLQPELQGVDPHSEDLTLEQKVMILYECTNNPWYYLREIVLDKGAGLNIDDCRYKANRGNIAAMWLLLSSIDYIQIQIRQTGKSFGTDVNTLWLMYFSYSNTTLNIITKDEPTRKTNITRLKKIRDEWPDYINRNGPKDDNNQITLSCNALENKLFTHVSQNSEKAADKLGRGMTSPYLDIDEGPSINQIETTVTAAMGSMVVGREIAHRRGVPHCAVFTTTAGKQDDRDGRYMYEMMGGAAIWNESLFDCVNRENLVSLIKTNCHGRATMVNLTLSHRQLGKTDEWLYEKIAAARSSGGNIDRDYFNIWTSGSKGGLLLPELAMAVRSSETDAIDNWISKELYIFRWYEVCDPNEMYVLAVDTSNAIGRDDIANILINSRTGATAGTAAFNDTNLMRYANWLFNFLVKHENVLLIIENKHNAQVIIDYLLLKLPSVGIDPFKRMFNRIVQNKQDKKNDYNVIASGGTNRPQQHMDKYRQYFGFITSSSSRDLLYGNVFINAAKEIGHLIKDGKLIQQILGLQEKNGRIDHQSGMHDDMVIAWLMAHWLLNYGIGLSFYGIDSSKVMLERASNGSKLTPTELYDKAEQVLLTNRVNSLREQLSNSNIDQLAISRLESELAVSMLKVKTSSGENMTIDAIIEESAMARGSRGNLNSGGISMRDRMLKTMMRR